MQMTGRHAYADGQAEVLETTRRPSARTDAAGGQAGATRGEAFVLRLCLDLQIDAMMLALGAAAVESDDARGARSLSQTPAPVREPLPGASVTSMAPSGAAQDGSAPRATARVAAAGAAGHWRSWLDEDVDFVRRLAADVAASGVRLPATLGPNAPAAIVDNLAARYEAMWSLLEDLHGRDQGTGGRAGKGGTAAVHAVDTVREHIRRRLAWLGEEQAARSRAVPVGVAGPLLPGELLG